MTLAELADILFVKQRRTFLAVFLTAFGAGAALTFLLPKQYESTASLFVGENRPLIANGGNPVPVDQVRAQTYRELLGTPRVAQMVAKALPWKPSPEELAGSVTFEIAPGTHLIEITATAREPVRAQKVANAYAAAFVRDRRRTAASNSRSQLVQLRERIRSGAERVERLRRAGRGSAAVAQAQSELDAARREYAQVSANATLQGANVSVAAKAVAATAPARPKPALYLVVAAVLATMLAVAAALLRSSFDRKVRDPSEVEDIFSAPVLAQIPDVRRRDTERDDSLREAFDFLRTNLELVSNSRGPTRMIAVTSDVPGTGKSTVVAELAKSFARVGRRVIAVECDLRKPQLGERFSVNGAPGLTNILGDGTEAAGALQTTETGVRVLLAGPLPRDPAVSFQGSRLQAVFETLRSGEGYVLIDTAPLLAAPETSNVADVADGVVLVVNLREARRDALIATRDQLDKVGARLVGIVLNRAPGAARYGYISYHGGVGAAHAPHAGAERV